MQLTIEMKCNQKKSALIIGVALMLVLTGCKAEKKNEIVEAAVPVYEIAQVSTDAVEEIEVEEIEPLWSEQDLAAITQTLSGECYDDKEHEKRRVVEVILNRVSDGRFGDSIYEVVSAKNQFVGYWNPSRPVSESDIRIAEQTLQDWHNNDCKPLSKYLYFRAGENRENLFYENIEW